MHESIKGLIEDIEEKYGPLIRFEIDYLKKNAGKMPLPPSKVAKKYRLAIKAIEATEAYWDDHERSAYGQTIKLLESRAKAHTSNTQKHLTPLGDMVWLIADIIEREKGKVSIYQVDGICSDDTKLAHEILEKFGWETMPTPRSIVDAWNRVRKNFKKNSEHPALKNL